MTERPHSVRNPYNVGDQVRLYLGADDPKVQYHGTVCEIVAVLTGGLGPETGRPTDVYAYTLRNVETNEELPVTFRHRDVVPIEDTPMTCGLDC